LPFDLRSKKERITPLGRGGKSIRVTRRIERQPDSVSDIGGTGHGGRRQSREGGEGLPTSRERGSFKGANPRTARLSARRKNNMNGTDEQTILWWERHGPDKSKEGSGGGSRDDRPHRQVRVAELRGNPHSMTGGPED